ncbi:MAG: hypothetical protein OEY52_15425 [Gammaproteobacteria bacterium]|nr:hypothetical protein [Gammaproteobacteria bacterium]
MMEKNTMERLFYLFLLLTLVSFGLSLFPSDGSFEPTVKSEARLWSGKN